MKKVYAFVGDFYHEGSLMLDAFQKSVAVLGADFSLVEGRLSDLGAILDSKPAALVFGRENRLNPEDKIVENWLTAELDGKILDYVKQGGRLVAVHAGMSCYPRDSAYRQLLKGHFVHHPEAHVRVRYEGMGFDFEVLDEHYFVEVDADTEVFLKSHSVYGTQDAGWRHLVGVGRVICLVPTHNLEGFMHSETLRLLGEVIQWVLD